MKVKQFNLFGVITDNLVGECIKFIQETYDDEIKKLPDDRKSVLINVFTDGGDIDAMLALCDVIESLNKKKDSIRINTHLLRKAHSAGWPIWLCGYERTVSRSADAMYHDMCYGLYSNKETHKEMLDYSEHLENLIVQIVTENYKITKEELRDIRTKRINHFIDGETLMKNLKKGYRKK